MVYRKLIPTFEDRSTPFLENPVNLEKMRKQAQRKIRNAGSRFQHNFKRKPTQPHILDA